MLCQEKKVATQHQNQLILFAYLFHLLYGYFSPHLETQPFILFIQDDTPATIVKMYCSRGVTLKKISIIKKLLSGSRGGVKDTRLEAMAKDRLSEDRSSQGHGQESSRPRSRFKDTTRKCSQKRKKGLRAKKFANFLQNFSLCPKQYK